MARITLNELEVTSFFPSDDPAAALAAQEPCTEEVTGCEFTYPNYECVCTSDISNCPRTSIEGGCDTSVQCVTGPR